MSKHWTLGDAKNKLSEVVNRARDEGPQFIKRRNDEFVLLKMDEYEELTGKKMTFSEYLIHGPIVEDLELERPRDPMRKVEW